MLYTPGVRSAFGIIAMLILLELPALIYERYDEVVPVTDVNDPSCDRTVISIFFTKSLLDVFLSVSVSSKA